MDPILSPAELANYIRREAIHAELIGDIGNTPTVPDAARALGVASERIIKTLLFLVKQGSDERQPIVVIGHGPGHIEKGPLARHIGVGKKRIQLASPERVIALTGYPAGGVPPFGHRTKLRVLMDRNIERLGPASTVYAGGGDDRTMLGLQVAELIRVVQPEIIELG